MKEGKVFKRILAIALVVVMTITMMPFGVFAAEGECAHNTGEHTVIQRVEPTCTEDGHYRYFQCKCGVYFNRLNETNNQLTEVIEDPTTFGVIPNLGGHTWNDATCTNPKVCSVCNTTEGEALGHTGGIATCIAKAICSECGEAYGHFAPHTWATGFTVDKEANCTEAGSKSKHCTVDGCDEKTEVNLKDLGKRLGAGSISFASVERLEKLNES